MQKKDFRHKITVIPYQEPSDNVTKSVCDVKQVHQDFFKAQDIFYDVITAVWDEVKNHLTPKQRIWAETFRSLDNPTSTAVARKLDISRIENDFHLLKDVTLIRFRPIRHWTDSKIRAFAFCCVVLMILIPLKYKRCHLCEKSQLHKEPITLLRKSTKGINLSIA
jgi:hypothetical protein